MKILQINASYKPAYIYGGPTMSVSKLSEEMMRAGCTIEVFTTTANGVEELSAEPNSKTLVNGVPVTYFRRITKDHTHFSPALLKSLRKNIRDFDLVHIHAWWNLVSILSCQIAINRGIPVVISPRGTLSTYSFSNRNSLSKKLIHHLLGKYLLRRSYFHVTSERESEAIRMLTNQKGIFNIPNFIKLSQGQTESYLPNDPLRMIFLSRIEEKKGLEILFDALVDIDLPYKLTIAGEGKPGYVDRLKMFAKQRGIEPYIDWVGFLDENKFDFLQHQHLMVLPSHDENFGNVVLESLSGGTAVLISKNVGLADYVSENNLGWVCDNTKIAFKEMIKLINSERQKLLEIRAYAPSKIQQDFDDDILTKRYMHMYQHIIKNG